MSKLVTISLVVGLVASGMILAAEVQNHNNDCRVAEARIKYLNQKPPETSNFNFKTMDEFERQYPPTCPSLSTENFINSILGGLLIAICFYPIALFAKLLFKLEKML